jgi:hypothetical protein
MSERREVVSYEELVIVEARLPEVQASPQTSPPGRAGEGSAEGWLRHFLGEMKPMIVGVAISLLLIGLTILGLRMINEGLRQQPPAKQNVPTSVPPIRPTRI